MAVNGQNLNGERFAEDGGTCDLLFTFQGTGEVLRAHEAVLAAASPVFEQMLCGPLIIRYTLKGQF